MTIMSSSTINSDTTPYGAAESQKARPRRRRAPRTHDAATATTPVAEQASAPAIPEAPAAETALLSGATDDAQRARAAGTGRSRRGRGRGEGRKSAVQLIVPLMHGAAEGAAGDESAEQAAATEPAAQETPSTQETAPVATAEARVVPVTTEATPAATTEAALPAEAAPARSRYRFAPRTPVVTAAPLVRPERLSNGATSANAAEELQPAPATTATPATDADEGGYPAGHRRRGRPVGCRAVGGRGAGPRPPPRRRVTSARWTI